MANSVTSFGASGFERIGEGAPSGSSFGIQASDKISFYGSTPVIQPTGIGATSDTTAPATTGVSVKAEFQDARTTPNHLIRLFAPYLLSLQAWQRRNIDTREKYQKGSRNWQLSVPKYCQLNELCPPAHKVEEPWRL